MKQRKNLIIGMGKSGKAAYALLREVGESAIGFDDNTSTCQNLLKEGFEVTQNPQMHEFDRCIVSPGFPSNHFVIQQAISKGIPILGEAQLAFEMMSHTPQRRIGITGTNGKTTVTLLVTHVLNQAGQKAYALGNVGNPLSSYVKAMKAEEVAVVELSSYQLEKLSMPLFDVALILNITPDHLDRHKTMENYALAKMSIAKCLKDRGHFWVHESIKQLFPDLVPPTSYTYGTKQDCFLWTDRIAFHGQSGAFVRLPAKFAHMGWHDSENALAAWIACHSLGVTADQFYEALESFEKPAHRIEWCATIKDVDYINDSKGTNVDATLKAVEAMQKPVILIVGGVDKGGTYDIWKPLFKQKVKEIVALGQAAHKIEQQLQPEFKVHKVSSLKEALLTSQALAQRGEIVLLSPGCSSFDMFKDYAHRGEEFKKIVFEMKEKEDE